MPVFRKDYERSLRLARIGVLPFFLVASWMVWVWTRRFFGEAPALAAVFLFQGLPLVLAHSGLATMDVPAAALLAVVLYLELRWIESPSTRRALGLGAAAGLAVLTKHSMVPFVVAGSLPILAAKWIAGRRTERWPASPLRRRLGHLALAGAVCLFVAWAGYRFSLTPPSVPSGRPHSLFRLMGIDRLAADHPRIGDALNRLVETPMPFGDLFRGGRLVAAHNAVGHPAVFLGEVRETGWWQFFPVLLAVKTPIPFLIFLAIGCGALFRRGRENGWKRFSPILASGAILLLAMTSRIDIGLRHLLPIFPLLSVVAGLGLHDLLRAMKPRTVSISASAVLVLWFVASPAAAHPDYLPYFNELAGAHPERITVDSDLDWGQDVKRLFAALRDLPSGKLWYACVGCAYLNRVAELGVPGAPPELEELAAFRRVSGFVAVSEWAIAVKGEMERRRLLRTERGFDWLRSFPFRRVGASIRLYRVPAR